MDVGSVRVILVPLVMLQCGRKKRWDSLILSFVLYVY